MKYKTCKSCGNSTNVFDKFVEDGWTFTNYGREVVCGKCKEKDQ